MLDYKGILHHYQESCKTKDEFKNKITPFMTFLSYLDTAKDMLVNATTVGKTIPDEFGLKEIKDKVKEITNFLNEYSGESVVKDMTK